MSSLPAGIVFINNDISDNQRSFIGTQLFANEIITKEEFDIRIQVDPNYPDLVRNMDQRLVVILTNFKDPVNRHAADVVLFLKGGLAYVEGNNVGPPKLGVNLLRLDIYTLLRFNKSKEVVVRGHEEFGCSCSRQETCGCTSDCGCGKGCCETCRCCDDPNCPQCNGSGLGGIFKILTRRHLDGVHAPNCDSLVHNKKFQNRPV